MTWCLPKGLTQAAAAALVLLPLHAVAQEKQLDPAFLDRALKTGAAYAEDVSLIFYCLRRSPDLELAYFALQDDLQQTLDALETAGASPRQLARLVHGVLGKVRFSPPAEDAALDKTCVEKDVEKQRAVLQGVAQPLVLRPPFAELKR